MEILKQLTLGLLAGLLLSVSYHPTAPEHGETPPPAEPAAQVAVID